MTKKPGGVLENITGVFGIIKDTIVSSVKTRVKENFDHAMEMLEERLVQIQRRVVRSLGVSLFAFAAIISVLLAGMFYVLDTLGISRAGALLCLGIAFAIVSVLLYFISRKRGSA